MTEKTVDVYLLAQARAGIERATLVRNLAALFKKDIPAIEKILARPRTLIKAGVDTAMAEKYCRAIRQAGCECELVEQDIPVPSAEAPASVMTPQPATLAGSDVETATAAVPDRVNPAPVRPPLIEKLVSPRLLLPVVILAAISITVLVYFTGKPTTPPAASAVTSPANTAQTATNSAQSMSSQPKPPELLRTYSDDKRMSLTTPTDWKGERRLNPEAAIGVANIRDNLYAVVLRENKLPFGSDFNLLRYSELITQGLKKSTQEFYVQQAPRQLSINGLAAQQAALAAKVDGINIIYVITTLETAEHFYVIYAWTLASRFPAQQALLKQVSESFTLH